MASECCKLTSGLSCGAYCFTSINSSISAELNNSCGYVIKGPTIGTVSISGYALDKVYTGCPAKASVTIPWVRRYDCDSNEVHFIFQKGGQASIVGDIAEVSVTDVAVSSSSISASAGGSPNNLYTDETESIGFNFAYRGVPIPFDTKTADGSGVKFKNLTLCGISADEMYLTSFSVNYVPGEVPIASYTFMYPINLKLR